MVSVAYQCARSSARESPGPTTRPVVCTAVARARHSKHTPGDKPRPQGPAYDEDDEEEEGADQELAALKNIGARARGRGLASDRAGAAASRTVEGEGGSGARVFFTARCGVGFAELECDRNPPACTDCRSELCATG